MSIEDKLAELREQWRTQPQNRSKIEMQARVLQIGQKYPKFVSVDDPFKRFVNNVKEALK